MNGWIQRALQPVTEVRMIAFAPVAGFPAMHAAANDRERNRGRRRMPVLYSAQARERCTALRHLACCESLSSDEMAGSKTRSILQFAAISSNPE